MIKRFAGHSAELSASESSPGLVSAQRTDADGAVYVYRRPLDLLLNRK